MSIKRSKPKSGAAGRKAGEEADAWAKAPEPEKVWADEVQGKPDASFVPYAMTSRFAKGQLLTHSKFGKGLVIGVETSRIEVIFEDGPKKLGHGG